MTSDLLRTRQGDDLVDVQREILILAEGKDEVDLVDYLLDSSWRPIVQVHDCGGEGGLIKLITSMTKRDLFDSRGRGLAVVTDADARPDLKFDAVCRALRRASLPVPDGPEKVITSGKVTTMVFITPGLGASGAAEELYLRATDPRRRELAEDYIDHVQAADFDHTFTSRPKAVLRSVLAGLPRSPLQPGDALQKGGFVHDSAALKPLQSSLNAFTRTASAYPGTAAPQDPV